MNWKQSDVAEALANLYLRLNGYLTSGLILHSPVYGEARTDIDYLAIRFPNHRQDLPMSKTSKFLNVQDGLIDVIICEVKSEEPAQFNKPIKENEKIRQDMLKWLGVFKNEKDVDDVARELGPLLTTDATVESASKGIIRNGVSVRPLLCCPAVKESTQSWCLGETEIFDFIADRFAPQEEKEEKEENGKCSPRYNFQQWGYSLLPVVGYFKDKKRPYTLTGLHEHLGVKVT